MSKKMSKVIKIVGKDCDKLSKDCDKLLAALNKMCDKGDSRERDMIFYKIYDIRFDVGELEKMVKNLR